LEENDRHWRGSPLDMGGSTMDAHGIKEVVLEFDDGDADVFRPRMREEFESYELHMMAAYLDSIAHSIRKGQKN
jgi:esterase/lipase superfamily enzyme